MANDGEGAGFDPVNNQIHLLETISRSGDIQQSSPCYFCRHQGLVTCPHGTVQKLGLCPDYQAVHGLTIHDIIDRMRASPGDPGLMAA